MGFLEELEAKTKKLNEREDPFLAALREKTEALTMPEIAPVSPPAETEPAETESEKKKWYEGWFQKGALEDGVNAKNIGKTILGTISDVGEDLGAGIIGMGEKALDALLYIAPYAAQGQYSPNGGVYPSLEQQMEQQILNDTLEAAKEANRKFIEKDLYDEEAVSKKIIGAPARWAGIDSEESSVLGEKSDALVQSGGQLLATAGLQAVGVPWFMTTGVTSFGGEAENAFNQGAEYGEAGMSAAISAGAEILSEKIGGIKFGGKSLTDVVLQPFVRGVSNKVVRLLANAGIDAVGEGGEEILSGYLSAIGQKMTYMDDKELNELFTKEDKMDAFIGGFILGGGANVVGAVKSEAQGKDAVTGLTKNEQAVVDKVYKDEIAKEEQDGKKLNALEKSKLYDKVVEDMDKGNISTDTIEEVLGGDTYKSYKDTIDSEEKLQQEYKELGELKEPTLAQSTRYKELHEQMQSKKDSTTRDELKTKLGEEVFGLVQGDRLIESYNERGRKSQAFKADLSQYESKYHDTIKRAAESGILNDTRRTHEFVDMIAKISADKGVLFDFTNNERLKESGFAVDGKQVNGYVTKDGITLNIDSAKSLNSVVGHEITHVLEGTELYDALQNAVIEYARGKNDYQGRVEALSEIYKGVEGADISKELTADLVGDYLFGDTDFINSLSTGNRNVFQKIYDEIKYLCKVATAGSKEARELEKVKRAFENVYRAQKNTARSGVDYALSKDINGDVFVDVTEDIFDATSGESVARTIQKVIAERFDNLIETNGQKFQINKTTNDEFRRSESATELMESSPAAYNDKLKTIANADEILTAAKNWIGEKIKHTRKDDIVEFGRGNVMYRVGENGYVADVIVGIRKNGAAVLYDLVNIYDTKIADAPVTMASDNNSQRRQDASAGDNVAQKDADVKQQYSLSDSNGKQLTKEQQEYFKDSKMRDENGNLKVMYHGTPNGDFTVFRDGTYFTDSKEYADRYQSPSASSISTGKVATNPKTFEVYLDIKKPFDIADAEARDIYINDYIKGGNALGINPYLSDAEYAKISTIDWTEGEDLRDFLIENGYDYDGLVLDEGGAGGYGEEVEYRGKSYVIFSPEQVKNADNLKPTKDEDIRRSLSREGEQFAPTRRNEVYGRDIRLEQPTTEESSVTEDIAPVTVAENTTVAAPNVTEAEQTADLQFFSRENEDDITDIAPVPASMAVRDSNPTLTEKYEPAKAKQPKTTPQEQVRAQILTEEPETAKRKSGAWSVIKDNFIDKGTVFETLDLKRGSRELQGRFKAIGRAESKAQYFMEHGDAATSSLKAIRDTVESSGKTKDFYEYLYHQHNVDRMSLEERFENVENKPVFGYDVTAEMSRAEVAKLEKANPEFKGWAQEVYGNMNYLRQMLVDGGVISNDTAKLWAKRYPHYVPIRRAGYEGLNINVPLDTRRTGINAPVKKATGGNRDILPLFDTMAMRTEQTFKAVARNRFGVELKNALGIKADGEDVDIDEAIDSVDTHEELLQEGKNGRKPTFTVFEDGKKVTFEIEDEMYDTMKPKDRAYAKINNSRISKGLQAANNIRRGLITEYNPAFMITNPIKDTQDVLINSQHPAKTYANIPKAISELWNKNGQYYQEYMSNGGDQNTYFDSTKKTFTKEKSGLAKVIGFPLEKISAANNFIERVPRMAEYIASRKEGRSIDVAMLDAARVTTDFSAGGDLVKLANRNGFTFLNASVQGAVQQVRNVREAKAEGLKGWAKLAAKVAVAGLPAALLNHLLWDDDEDYAELSDYVKQNYYIVGKFGDGQFVRIPKGRTLAVIQDAFEQMENFATGNDEVDFEAFAELVVSNLAPNNPLENNIIAPITQAVKNKAWYGDDLVPTRLQNLPPAEQYDESTDSVSRWLGDKVNISPYKINYVLDQYSGAVGDMLLPMLTPEAERGNNTLIAPVIDKFTTDSVMNNQNVSDFYDTKEELTVNANAYDATDEDKLMSKYMNSINSELGKLYGEKREIQNSSLSDAEKYEAAREIQKQIIALTKESLNTYDDIRYEGDIAVIGDRYYRKDEEGEWQKLSGDEVTKYEVTSAAGDAPYASDGTNHYRWYEPGEDSEAEPGWRKISDDELKKQKEVTSALGISAEEYWGNKEEYSYAYDYPENYAVAKAVGGYESYKTYTRELYDIKADKDENGKSISGSRKEKVLDYINSMDADYYTKIILFKNEYNADDTYNYEIIDYLNGRNDISAEEMTTILRKLGFDVDSEGNISW